MLARPNRRTEYVRILAIVVPELELIDVERQIQVAHLMERSHDAALYHRPKTLDGVRVDRTIDVLSGAVMNHAMRETGIQSAIPAMIVGREQTYLVRDRFIDELGKRSRIKRC